MKKYRFDSLCNLAHAGHSVTVLNLSTNQTGDILSCSADTMEVFTRDAELKTWDFRECQEITGRSYPQDDKGEVFSGR